ncbi:hypothetical protein CI610_01786 [invertebrate metagenome]|uniref:DUF1788 domain-containing protein n=1 Tax=invertebrate metagenome TaxID=1711999 RepID=A0A2H9T7S9_9ZZZZ
MSYKKLSNKELLDHLVQVVASDRFLKMQGLGNEVPFFICPYNVRRTVDIEKIHKNLINQLLNQGIKILDINLYDMCIDLLKDDDDWNWFIEHEATMAKDVLLESMQSILDVETCVIPAIAETITSTEHDVLILSGVGEVFPFIRSHVVLNNLQSKAKEKPMLMFFPGSYTHSLETGASLDLFGKLHDDKYYRAFNILHAEV